LTSAADYLVDRRKLARQTRFWRIAAFVAAAVAILAVGLRAASTLPGAGGAHIARLKISGVIAGEEQTRRLIHDIASSSARAVLVDIDSPGGTTEGSEQLYLDLRELSEKKPIVAVVGPVAASGAYIAALGADRIVVRGNSIVGSIGVLVEFPNFSGLLDKLGVQWEEIKSSPLKAAPNGLNPTSPEAREAMAAIVADSYTWFKDLVKTRRGLSDEELARVSDGRIFTGRQGVELKLADEIGGEKEAIDWLAKEKGIDKNLPVREWKPEDGLSRLGLISLAADAVGLKGVGDAFRRADNELEASSLEGLTSIWSMPGR